MPRIGSRRAFSRPAQKAQEPKRSLNRYRLEKRWIQAPFWFLSFLDSKAHPTPGAVIRHDKENFRCAAHPPKTGSRDVSPLWGFRGQSPLGGGARGGRAPSAYFKTRRALSGACVPAYFFQEGMGCCTSFRNLSVLILASLNFCTSAGEKRPMLAKKSATANCHLSAWDTPLELSKRARDSA